MKDNENRRPMPQAEADGIIEGRNAVIEALRAGTAIDKIYLAKGDMAQGLVRLALGNENLIYAAAYAQSLDNGISALDYIVFDLKIVFLVLHFFTCAHICR